MSKKSENRLLNVYYVLIIFIFIYTSNKSILYCTLLDKDIAYYIFFGFGLLSLFLALIKKHVFLKIESLLLSIIIIFVCLFDCFIYNDITVNNLTFIFIIIAVFLYSISLDLNRVLLCFTNVLFFLSVCSLIGTFVIQPLYMSGHFSFFKMFESIEGYPIINLYFSFPLAWSSIQRNFGVFNEPGTYQFFIILAYCVEKFYVCKESKISLFKRLVFIITLVSTFSAAGIVSFAVIILYVIMDELTKNKKGKTTKIIITILVCAITLLYAISNERIVTLLFRSADKLKNGLDNSSFYVRFMTPLRTLAISIHNPITGLSFNKAYEMVYAKYYSNNLVHITGTFIIYISGLGIPIGLLLLYLFYKSCRIIANKNNIVTIFVFLSLFLSCMSQNFVILSLFIFILYFSFMRCDGKKKVIKI